MTLDALIEKAGDAVADYTQAPIQEAYLIARAALLAVLPDIGEHLAGVVEQGFDRPGIKTKHDKCAHDRFGWEDCEECAVLALRAEVRRLTGGEDE